MNDGDPNDECECEGCQRIAEADALTVIRDFQCRMLDGMTDAPPEVQRVIEDHFWDMV